MDFTDDMRRRLERLVGDESDHAKIEVLAGDVRALLRAWAELPDLAEDHDKLVERVEDLEGELRDANETIAALQAAEEAA